MIEGHGDDLFRYGNRVKINFSSNIPQKVDHSGLMTYLQGLGDIFKNYPEPSPLSIEHILARNLFLDENRVIVANGATEIIYLLAQLFINGHSTIVIPTFREYQDACKLFFHQIKFIRSIDSVTEDGRMVWLCNPNNPTGITYDYDKLLRIIRKRKETLFVVDQAYGLYSVKKVLTIDNVLEYNNLILLESFTKQFSVPGLRVGYAIGSEFYIERLKSMRMPWSVNSISIEAAKYLLSHQVEYRIDIHVLHKEALRMIAELRKVGYNVLDTDCNFFLAETPVGTAGKLKEWLIEKYGILIRDASNFGSLSDKFFRIAVQDVNENNFLIKALTEWIRSY